MDAGPATKRVAREEDVRYKRKEGNEQLNIPEECALLCKAIGHPSNQWIDGCMGERD